MLSRIAHSVAAAADPQYVAAQIRQAHAGADTHVSSMASRIDCPQNTQQNLTAAKAYMNARLAGRVDVIQQLVDPNISFMSQRDGTHQGHKAFFEYINKTPTEGQWAEPSVDPSGLVRIDGKIKYGGLIPVNVKGIFRFSNSGKITELFVGKS